MPYTGEQARPVQTLVWYPAAPPGPRIPYSDYIRTEATDDNFGRAKADVDALLLDRALHAGIRQRLPERRRRRPGFPAVLTGVSLYPNDSNLHDSLAEGYEAVGNKPLAAASYQRSLELDPKNGHAVERLQALK